VSSYYPETQDATVPLHHSTLVRVKYILQHLL
jgi:hypothetical protein